jgi:hypothetical protein
MIDRGGCGITCWDLLRRAAEELGRPGTLNRQWRQACWRRKLNDIIELCLNSLWACRSRIGAEQCREIGGG